MGRTEPSRTRSKRALSAREPGQSRLNHQTSQAGSGSTKVEECPPRTGEPVPLWAGQYGLVDWASCRLG